MHELSIACSIVDIAKEHMQSHNALRISTIELDIGKLAGIEYDAFDFAWPEATNNTILENAEKKINKPEGKAVCNNCKKEFPIENIFDLCPECAGMDTEIIGGKELLVRKIELILK